MSETTKKTEKKEFELTGRHVLAITVSAFAVIIAVNVFMAISAVETFPGLETENSYVASQEFNRRKAAQLALGWDVSADVDGENLILDIRDTDGKPVEVTSIYAIFGRATHVRDDQEPTFQRSPEGPYIAHIGKPDFGNWNLRVNITAQDGTPFQQRIPIHIKKPG